MAQPTQTDPQFKLRFPADLKDRVQQAAADNNRSMNAEIVANLEEKHPSPDLDLKDIADLVRKLVQIDRNVFKGNVDALNNILRGTGVIAGITDTSIVISGLGETIVIPLPDDTPTDD